VKSSLFKFGAQSQLVTTILLAYHTAGDKLPEGAW